MTIEDLKETAAMAHLSMDEKELARVYPAFEQVLGLLSIMQAAANDTAAFPSGLVPASSTELAGAFGNSRTVNSGFYRSAASAGEAAPPPDNSASGLNETMLNNSGERDGRFIVVPNVL